MPHSGIDGTCSCLNLIQKAVVMEHSGTVVSWENKYNCNITTIVTMPRCGYRVDAHFLLHSDIVGVVRKKKSSSNCKETLLLSFSHVFGALSRAPSRSIIFKIGQTPLRLISPTLCNSHQNNPDG